MDINSKKGKEIKEQQDNAKNMETQWKKGMKTIWKQTYKKKGMERRFRGNE